MNAKNSSLIMKLFCVFLGLVLVIGFIPLTKADAYANSLYRLSESIDKTISGDD